MKRFDLIEILKHGEEDAAVFFKMSIIHDEHVAEMLPVLRKVFCCSILYLRSVLLQQPDKFFHILFVMESGGVVVRKDRQAHVFTSRNDDIICRNDISPLLFCAEMLQFCPF